MIFTNKNIKLKSIFKCSYRPPVNPICIDCPSLGPILDYSNGLIFQDLKSVSIKNCTLKGRDLIPFINRLVPSSAAWPTYRRKTPVNLLRQLLGLYFPYQIKVKNVKGVVCSLASHPEWENNIFHWFMDIIPRIFAAEAEAFDRSQIRLIKPGRLLTWQKESLELMGYKEASIVTIPENQHISVKTELFVFTLAHRQRTAKGLPPFPIFPCVINALQSRFSHIEPSNESLMPSKILIIRAGSSERKFVNFDQIEQFARQNNFIVVELSSLSIANQIRLFKSSTHIIAAHGAGLTHLIHCSQAAVLEIYSIKHGIRPDYFQIAAINNLRYYYHICPAVNEQGDMTVDLNVLETFIRQTGD